MKGTDEHFTARGLGKVVLLALLVDLVIYPFSQSARAPAQQALPASLLNTAVTLLLTLPLLKLAQQVKEPGQATGTKVLWGTAALLFACGGGEGIVRAEGFVRYVSDEPLPHLVVYVLLLAAAFYAMRGGIKALARTSGVLLCLFALSLAMLVVSNARSMRLENLTAQPFDAVQVASAAWKGFRFPAELALFFFFAPPAEGRPRCSYRRTLLLLCGAYLVLTMTAELVMGGQSQIQSQAVHALSRLGRMSVFRRLDALHVGVWLLASLAKASAFGLGLQQALERLLPEGQRPYADRYALAGLVLGTMCCAGVPYTAVETTLTVLTALWITGLALAGAKGGKPHETRKTHA